jgi:hypothetical protein
MKYYKSAELKYLPDVYIAVYNKHPEFIYYDSVTITRSKTPVIKFEFNIKTSVIDQFDTYLWEEISVDEFLSMWEGLFHSQSTLGKYRC